MPPWGEVVLVMSYTSLDCQGQMICPKCNHVALRYRLMGINLSDEEREKFAEYEECQCSNCGTFELR